MKKGMLMLKMVNMGQTINQKRPPSSMNKKEGSALVWQKIENKNEEITGKRCPVFDYTNKKIVTIGAYKK